MSNKCKKYLQTTQKELFLYRYSLKFEYYESKKEKRRQHRR